MTISTTTARTTYNGNGITTVFPIPFRFLANGDIVVVSVSAVGVETTKTLTTDYTLSGAGDDGGGTVTMLVAPANGTRLVIYRDTDIVQETDYISGDPFPAETHERALDRLTMIAQEIGSDADRAIKVPVGDSDSLSTTLPAAANRLDKFIVFDSATGATELSTVTQTQVASAVAAAYSAGGSTADAVTFIQEGTGAVSRSIQSKARDSVSVADFGAVGDGVTDDTAAIQAAIDYCTGDGKQALYFPANVVGKYYKITSTLIINGRLNIFGDGPFSTTIIAVGFTSGQYILDFDNLAASVVYFGGVSDITLRSDNSLAVGMRIKNLSYMLNKNVQFYGLLSGIFITGTNCFSNFFEEVTCYSITSYGVYMDTFTGGGHYLFNGCTFTGNIGLYVSNASVTDSLSILNCNFEQAVANDVYIAGTVRGLTISGCRSEGLNGASSFLLEPAAAQIVSGISITGCYWTTDFANAYAVDLGGSGFVRGFAITGNHANYLGAISFVRLNGAGEAGVISGNYCVETPTAKIVNAPRNGVVCLANQNPSGAMTDYWNTGTGILREGSYTGTGTGFTVSPTGTFKYAIAGKSVTLDIVQLAGTSNATTLTVTGAPAEIFPSADKDVYLKVADNGGSAVIGLARIKTTGVIEVYATISGGAFTAAGTKTLGAASISYTLN